MTSGRVAIISGKWMVGPSQREVVEERGIETRALGVVALRSSQLISATHPLLSTSGTLTFGTSASHRLNANAPVISEAR
jgi:hypothetical protein